MKLWTLIISSTALLLILSGCGATSPVPKEKVAIDKTLPMVTLTKAGTFVDMNAIAFEWKSFDDTRVKGIHIYKQNISKSKNDKISKLAHFKTISNRFTTHFVDTDITPDTRYKYSFKTYTKDAESIMSSAKVLNSLPVLQSVSWIQSIQNMPRSAKIIWRPHTSLNIESYIVQRRTLQDSKWRTIAKINNRLNAEYIDMDLKDNFIYKYRIRAITFDKIISSPSEIVKVVTKSLPKSITKIKTTLNLPKKIKINWKKSNNKDLDRYYIYKSEIFDGKYELIAKLYNNTFVDNIDEDAKVYFYRVSAVEKNGLESIHNKLSVQGMTLSKPNAPELVSARLVNGRVELVWNTQDSRAKTFTVLKKVKTGWFEAKEEEITKIKGKKFIDSEVGPNISYIYKVYALDKFGIKSNASIEIELKTPKTLADNSKVTHVKKDVNQKNKKIKSPVKKVKDVKITPLNDFN